MYFNKSDYGQRRPCSSRDARPWDEEIRREEREPKRNSIRDQCSVDGHSSRAERVSSRDYSELLKRGHSPDSKRDWRRKSPVRQRMPSPERGVSEKRRRTMANEDYYRYQREPEESCRSSPEHCILTQRNNDFKRTVSLEVYGHKRTPESSRYSQQQDVFHYSKYQDQPSYRCSSEYYTDKDSRERSRERSQERTQSRDVLIKSFTPPRQQSSSFSIAHEEYNHKRSRFSLNGSSLQTGEPSIGLQSPPLTAAAGEKKMSKGFQRFLDVLNRGVNVDTLTKIVSRGTPDVNVHPQSPPSPNSAGQRWSVGSPQRQQGGLQNTRYWPETERTYRPASPPSRLYSSSIETMSEERPYESSHFERKFLDNISRSPSALEKTTLRPEEEHKHKQMQDVLQAIGIDLEYEELGQMSNRIQERLYGKKQIDSAPNPREEKQRRHPYIPKHRSRSSSRSSSSSFQDYNNKSQSYSAQREKHDFSQTDRCGTLPSTMQTPAAFQFFSPTTDMKPKPKPPPSPAVPSNTTVNSSPYTHNPLNFPSIMPNFYTPQVPPYLMYPQTPLPVPPVNTFPPVVPQSRPFLPPPLNFPQPPFLNLPPMYPTQPVNTNAQKANKNANRPRCLQVISTKKPKD